MQVFCIVYSNCNICSLHFLEFLDFLFFFCYICNNLINLYQILLFCTFSENQGFFSSFFVVFQSLLLSSLSKIFLDVLPVGSVHFFHSPLFSNFWKPKISIIFYNFSTSDWLLPVKRMYFLKFPAKMSVLPALGKANIKAYI